MSRKETISAAWKRHAAVSLFVFGAEGAALLIGGWRLAGLVAALFLMCAGLIYWIIGKAVAALLSDDKFRDDVARHIAK